MSFSNPLSSPLLRHGLRQAARFLSFGTIRESVDISDMALNVGFMVAAIVAVTMSVAERPEAAALKVWIGGYGVKCGLHIACVFLELRKRRQRRWRTTEEAPSNTFFTLSQFTDQYTSTSDAAQHLESVNMMFSFVWWLLGFYWVSHDEGQLIEQSPLLYWLCVVFLAFDVFSVVFFVVLFVALACVIGVVICCFLLCIIAFVYAKGEKESATATKQVRIK